MTRVLFGILKDATVVAQCVGVGICIAILTDGDAHPHWHGIVAGSITAFCWYLNKA